MKIIDTKENLKEHFDVLPVGATFKFNGNVFLKMEDMVGFKDLEKCVENDNIYDIEQVEAECEIINAIRLSDNYYSCFDAFEWVEPIKTELHIV